MWSPKVLSPLFTPHLQHLIWGDGRGCHHTSFDVQILLSMAKKKKNWHCENNCFVFGINCSAPISHNIPTSKLPAQNWFISNDALFFLFNFILLDTNKIARSICYWANWNVRKRGKNTILIKYNIFNCKVYQAFYKCKKLLTRKWFFL